VYQHKYASREEARQSIFRWIETFYNRTRLHSTLGYASPEQFDRIPPRTAAPKKCHQTLSDVA
jgi:putative transposase